MTKDDKRLRRVKGKHLPDLEPSQCVSKPKPPKKPEPRYRAECWHPEWRSGKCRGGGYWSSLGSAKSLEEARHLACKPSRGYVGCFGSDVICTRVVDTNSGEQVWVGQFDRKAKHPQASPVSGARGVEGRE